MQHMRYCHAFGCPTSRKPFANWVAYCCFAGAGAPSVRANIVFDSSWPRRASLRVSLDGPAARSTEWQALSNNATNAVLAPPRSWDNVLRQDGWNDLSFTVSRYNVPDANNAGCIDRTAIEWYVQTCMPLAIAASDYFAVLINICFYARRYLNGVRSASPWSLDLNDAAVWCNIESSAYGYV